MNTKQLLRLAIALGAAVVLWITLTLVRRPVRDSDETLRIATIDTAQVDSVIMIRAADTTRIVRVTPRAWQVNGLPASAVAIQALFATINDTSLRSEIVSQNATSHSRLGVAGDSALRVRIAGGGNTLFDISVGKRAGSLDGIYVKPQGDDRVFALSGAITSSLSENVDQWRDKQIAAVASDSVATIEIRKSGAAYTLRKPDTTWQFANGAAASQSGVTSLLALFGNLTAQGFPSAAQSDSINPERSRRSIRLLGRDSRVLLHLRFDSTASGIWVRHDSGGPVFRIDTWTYSGLAPEESTLRGGEQQELRTAGTANSRTDRWVMRWVRARQQQRQGLPQSRIEH